MRCLNTTPINVLHNTMESLYIIRSRGRLTTHGAPGQLGIMGPLCPCPHLNHQKSL
ncbi:unnamed protein product [Staurois parvus]|uniref:Uncharacterized protein n=1 Tax=Staurois parvus TaxID=386267 RepID=A0ABN9G921_9NEOB|nr:unnamed protein product [Staurois parvus]